MLSKSTGRIALFGLLLVFAAGGGLLVFSGGKSKSTRHDALFDPLANCVTKFGTPLGYAGGIPAFSNCHHAHRAQLLSFTRFGHPHSTFSTDPRVEGTFISGTPWAALEYAYRFLFHHKGLRLYGSEHPSEVWSAKYFHNPFDHLGGGFVWQYDVVRLENFAEARTSKERKRMAPRFSDIVVWPGSVGERFGSEGHVAVVVHTEDDVEAAGGREGLLELTKERLQPQLVYIAEQNFDNRHWEGRNYSRVLRFSWRDNREAVLQDPDENTIVGWIRPGKMERVHAVDDDL